MNRVTEGQTATEFVDSIVLAFAEHGLTAGILDWYVVSSNQKLYREPELHLIPKNRVFLVHVEIDVESTSLVFAYDGKEQSVIAKHMDQGTEIPIGEFNTVDGAVKECVPIIRENL